MCITDLSLLLLCSCVFRKVMEFKPTCMYSVTKLSGVVRTVGRVSLVCSIVTTVPIYGVDRSFWLFQVKEMCFVGGHFTLYT